MAGCGRGLRIRSAWRRRTRPIAPLVALLLSLVLAAPTAALTGWAGPTRLSSSAGELYSTAIDASGRYHIAYESHDGIHFLSNRSGSWADRTLRKREGDVRPSLALDGTGQVFIAFDANAEITGVGRSYGIRATGRRGHGRS